MQDTASRTTLLRQAASMKWFHAIDFGDAQTSGRMPAGGPQNTTLYGVMDLLPHVGVSGLKCIDVGTAHGIVAFHMASRGGDVTATDIFDDISPPFNLARSILNLPVHYETKTSLDNIVDRVGAHSQDVMVCAGVMYHLVNPYQTVFAARKVLKSHGLLLLETAYLPGEKRAIIDFNPASGTLPEIYTYTVPSKSAVLGMLRFGGFDILAVRQTANPDRLTVLARSVPVAAVRGRSAMMARLHDTGVIDPSFVAVPPGLPSAASYDGPEDDTDIDWTTYVPDFFPHPSTPKPSLGSTVWVGKGKNF